ncbi:MAG: hypothetical protein MUF23_17135 [Pirellula sp.]|nr:hypothetical protein [Pirellula sp.]
MNKPLFSRTTTTLIPDLTKCSEIFLVPSSFLVAALGTADTYSHKAAVSAIGLAVSLLWMICTLEARRNDTDGKPTARTMARHHVLVWFPMLFIVGWLVSLVVHVAVVAASWA